MSCDRVLNLYPYPILYSMDAEIHQHVNPNHTQLQPNKMNNHVFVHTLPIFPTS